MLITSKKQEIIDYIRNELKDDLVYDCKLTQHRDKRSAEQNALAWAYANCLRRNKFDVYFEMLKRYGQSFIVATELDEDLLGTYFKYYEKLSDGQYIIYRGSSEYDSYEIDGIMSEAEEMGIGGALLHYE